MTEERLMEGWSFSAQTHPERQHTRTSHPDVSRFSERPDPEPEGGVPLTECCHPNPGFLCRFKRRNV